jgi:uncharacterized protein with FMN-binding domain
MKKILTGAVVIAVLFGVFFLVIVCREYSEVEAIDRSPVNVSGTEDGVYEGSCETTLVKARVRVTVAGGRIDDIEILEHQCGKGKPANVIVEDMTDRNDIEVDAISGATISSEVIKAAVRDALR